MCNVVLWYCWMMLLIFFWDMVIILCLIGECNVIGFGLYIFLKFKIVWFEKWLVCVSWIIVRLLCCFIVDVMLVNLGI